MARKRKRTAAAIEVYHGEEDDDDSNHPTQNRNITFSRLHGRLAQSSGDIPANEPTSSVNPEPDFEWYNEDNAPEDPDPNDDATAAEEIVSCKRYLCIPILKRCG
jgi:hypothetical protein